jgi:hypothetical protein
MALVVFGGTYLCAGVIYWVVTALAVGERARAFKGISPGMLPPLGIIFALLVAFVASQRPGLSREPVGEEDHGAQSTCTLWSVATSPKP